ncbi:uncharacterized protein [Coffea arabica]|uniref:Uncharacterized protein isoform X3 n=1 Tax=Coffea arabica TaxID=13443 RepID=A0ABM4WYW1_COFAR
MGRNRVYGSLEEARAEKNRRSREQRAAARRETKNDAPLGVCTLAVTAFNIHDSNAVNQPNMGVIESSLGSGSILPFAENNAEHLQAENEENVCASIADGANEVSSTNLDVGEPSLRRQRRSRKPAITDPLATIATEPAVLPDVPSCPYCHAKRFHQEPPGFCCASGEVQLLSTEMPRELMLLYIEDSDEAAEFRRCVRSYNNMFAFTSIGIHPDKSLAANYNGVYTFRIQGQMYHYINPLIPENGEKPRNLQLYFVDTDHETTQRLSISSRFQETLVTKLEKILKINPYSAFFRGLQDLPGIDDYKIVLDTTPRLCRDLCELEGRFGLLLMGGGGSAGVQARVHSFLGFLYWAFKQFWRKGCMFQEGKRRSKLLSWRSAIRECSKPSCVTNGKRPGNVPMERTANLLMELRSCALYFATQGTRLRYAAWS